MYDYFYNRRGGKKGTPEEKERKQWQNSVRHNLSSHKEHFLNIKNEKWNGYCEKSGGYWTLHKEALQKALEAIENNDKIFYNDEDKEEKEIMNISSIPIDEMEKFEFEK